MLRRSVLVRLFAGALALAGAWTAYTQSQPATPVLKIQKINDDLYVVAMAEGVGGGNVAVYLTDEGVIRR